MSAELDYSMGDAAFVEFGDRVTAWHQQGRFILPSRFDGLTGEQKVELILTEARLDWEVLPHDVFASDPEWRAHPERVTKIEGWKQFRRSDNGHLMGIFKDSYTPLQNRDLLTLIEPMLDVGMATFETAGSLRNGEDVWGLFRFNPRDPVVQEFFLEENIIPYILMTNNHAQRGLVCFMETMIRVVCANTLGAATGALGDKRKRAGRYPGAVLLKHTKNVKSLSVDGVNYLWGTITDRYGKVAENYRQLKQRFLTEEEFESTVLDVIAPLPLDETVKRYQSSLEKAEAARTLVTELWDGRGRGITGDHSAFEAYNATAESLDWYADVMFRRSLRDRLEATVPGGTIADRKQDVLNGLTSLVLN